MTNSIDFAVLAQPDHSLDEIDVALLIDRILQPDIDPENTRAALTQLCAARPADQSAWMYLSELGYGGDQDHFDALDNSSLSTVLRTQRGIPISLAVVLMAAARSGGDRAEGINHPGHFLVRVNATLIDPFSMQPVEDQNLPAQSTPTDARTFALRMLNNLKYAHARNSNWHLALHILDQQLAIAPREFTLLLEQAEFWERLGATEHAAEVYQALLAQTTDAQIAANVESRLRRLDGASPQTWH